MMQIKYQNNRGQSVNLYGNGIVADPTDFVAWEVDADDSNGKISAFTTDVVSKSMNAATYSQEARQRLYEVPAIDLEDVKPGRLYIGEWYMVCYMTASEQTRWWATDGIVQYELTFSTDDPYWHKDVTYTYTERHDTKSGLDYPYDYEFNYGYAPTTVVVNNDNYLPGDAIIRFYGPCENPQVTIGSNAYGVNVELAQGDYVEISTYDKTVRVVRLDGDIENGFPDIAGTYEKGSGSYIFEQIKQGTQDVVWSGLFDFDVILIERRHEPRWS